MRPGDDLEISCKRAEAPGASHISVFTFLSFIDRHKCAHHTHLA
jgi:hypothetical protein